MADSETITPNKGEKAKSNVTDDTKLRAMRDLMDLEKEKEEQKAILDEIVSRIRTRRKNAKNAGVDLDAVDIVAKARKLDNPDEVVRQIGTAIDYLNIAHVTTATITAASLFGDAAPPKISKQAKADDILWNARDAGYKAAMANLNRNDDNAFEPGDEKHHAWDQGFKDGLKAKAATTAKEAPADKPKPANSRRERKTTETKH